ncbi:MAG TPA: Arc family DNA-binding protein [Myxococcales bacterium]|jgi:plasmid stability protein|nr:Arc family DNA-binding protein [Myxococcales bacterium]
MADILIRRLPKEVVSRLKKRAAAKGRSLQAELKEVLVEAARPDDLAKVREIARQLRLRTKGRPQTDSVELLREDRER